MSREKEAYRDNLKRIIEAFPNKEIITVPELSEWLGISARTVYKHFPIKKGVGISKATLARCLS